MSPRLLSMAAACTALLAGAASAEPPVRMRIPQPPQGHGFHFAVPFYYPVEREVVYVEREVIREVPVEPAPPPEPPPPPRKPYAVGASYDSLPGGCMKMIEEGVSFYYCGGDEWYRLVGARSFKAVAKP